MKENFQNFIRDSLLAMLQPIAKLCLSRGIHFQDFVELAKRAFVRAANKELEKSSRLPSVIKISVMTGLQRPEVNRLLEVSEQISSKDFVVRVVGQWSSDKRFLSSGKPKKLPTDGLNSPFARLVKTVSKDLNPHTVRFELERLGLIEVRSGIARLISPTYVTSGDTRETLRLGARDVSDLIESLSENAFCAHEVPNLQARTEYDNVPDYALAKIRNWFLEEGTKLHAKARAYLSKFDRDISPSATKGEGKNRVVIGTYSLISNVEEVSSEEKK